MVSFKDIFVIFSAIELKSSWTRKDGHLTFEMTFYLNTFKDRALNVILNKILLNQTLPLQLYP